LAYDSERNFVIDKRHLYDESSQLISSIAVRKNLDLKNIRNTLIFNEEMKKSRKKIGKEDY